ncbi:MAG: NADH-quinone oxidoreductase subunit J [Methylocystis sp.]|nr:MAG: NADH-quinone oxidoreductase subunit J [Methylocystis sp.]
MRAEDALLPVAIALPVGAMLLALCLGGRWTERIAVAFMPIGVSIAGAVAYVVWRDQRPLVYFIGGWAPPLGVAIRADGVAAAMLLTSALIASAAGLFACDVFRVKPGEKENRAHLGFWTLLLAIWAALNCVFVGWDLFSIYVGLEMLTFAAVPLVCLKGQKETFVAAMRYLLFALLGSVLYLLGATLVYAAYGSLDIGILAQKIQPEAAAWIALGAMTAGLLAKTALFPLHIWLPPAHAGAAPPASAILSALVVKGSFFVVVRLWLTLAPVQMSEAPAELLAILGSVAIFAGSVLALRQERLKLMIAYSTVAQIGYLFLMFPLAIGQHPWASAAWSGGALQAISHAFAKAAMFLSAGLIVDVVGHDRLSGLRGLGRLAPQPVLIFALAGMSLMGLPPSGGFNAKWLLMSASVQSGHWALALVMAVGGLLTAAYLYRVIAPALAPAENAPAESASTPTPKASSRGAALSLALALAAILLGFAPPELASLLAVGAPAATIERIE